MYKDIQRLRKLTTTKRKQEIKNKIIVNLHKTPQITTQQTTTTKQTI